MTTPLFAELEALLAADFPGSDLHRATAPIEQRVHLRFELGDPHPNGSDARLRQVHARALTLANACFAPDDRILLLVNDWGGTDPMFGNTTPRHLNDLLGAELLAGAEERRITELPDDDDDAPASFRQQVLAAPFARLPIDGILSGIANYEQGREPSIGQAVYLVAPARRVIFHMYDDRGLLILADRTERIAPLYRQYGEWIVPYWREVIDEIFAEG